MSPELQFLSKEDTLQDLAYNLLLLKLSLYYIV